MSEIREMSEEHVKVLMAIAIDPNVSQEYRTAIARSAGLIEGLTESYERLFKRAYGDDSI